MKHARQLIYGHHKRPTSSGPIKTIARTIKSKQTSPPNVSSSFIPEKRFHRIHLRSLQRPDEVDTCRVELLEVLDRRHLGNSLVFLSSRKINKAQGRFEGLLADFFFNGGDHV